VGEGEGGEQQDTERLFRTGVSAVSPILNQLYMLVVAGCITTTLTAAAGVPEQSSVLSHTGGGVLSAP
jgi:hypothetical protein